MLATGLIVVYGYVMEAFFGWYSANEYEQFMIKNRMTGPYALVVLGADPLQRHRAAAALVQAAAPNTAWLFIMSHDRQHRHVARALRHHRDVACTATSCRRRGACTTRRSGTSSTFIGTIGLFFTLLFLFVRFLPMISIFEMRTLLPEAQVQGRSDPTEDIDALMADRP